jgi:putative ABC transport system permease protein
MVNRVLFKDTFREIKHTFSRFLSIFFIVLLGVSFFAGIKATCPDMKLTADEYFDDRSLMDIHVVSTMGLTILDVDAIRDVPGVESLFYTYNIDMITNFNNWDYVMRVFALEDTSSSRYTGINGIYLLEGRMPEAPDECLAEYGHDIFPDLPIGSKIRLKSGTDREVAEDLRNTEFTVVGKMITPYYITTGRGMSGIGGVQTRGKYRDGMPNTPYVVP